MAREAELTWHGMSPSPLPHATILIVDDRRPNLLAMRALLEDLLCDIIEANSGEEAIELVQVRSVAVILLDVNMPGISGFETARRIRAQSVSRFTPIIFLTADDIDPQQLEEGYSLGAVDFLGKPLSPIVLRAKVKGFVELFQEKEQSKREADQFRTLVQGTKDYAIFMLDPNGKVVTWNVGAERLKGYSADEIIGQHFSKFYPQEALDRGWPQHELDVAQAEGRFEDEGWRIRKDGSQFWANVVITALHDQNGNLRGYSKVTRDMTERRKAEENAKQLVAEETARRVAEESAQQIQEQSERLRVTLASIGDAVITTDADGKVRFLNPVAENLVGWRSDEAARRDLNDVFRIINEKSREPVENPARRALREGRIVGLANHTLLIAKDGTERPIDDSAAPVRDRDGNIIGSILVFRDVSGQKKAERYGVARLAVIQALNQANSITDGANGVLRAVCEHLDRDIGLFWLVDETGLALRCVTSWHRPALQVSEFQADSQTRKLKKGEGLPGRIWADDDCNWILDVTNDPNFPRAKHAAQEGLHSAFGCPIVVGEQTLGVIEFFTRRVRESDSELLETMATVAGIIGQFIERKNSEEQLRKSEQRFSQFMQHLPGLAWIKDTQGRYVYANDAAQRAFRTPGAHLYGKTDDEVFPPHRAKQFRHHDSLALQSPGGVKVVEELEIEDGTLCYSLVSKFPIFGANGEVTYVGGMAIDITDQRRFEQALKQSEERFRGLMEQAPFSIQVLSPDGKTVRVNQAWEQLWGVQFDQIRDYNVLEDPQLEKKGVAPYLRRAFAGEPVAIPAIEYDPSETIPDLKGEQNCRRWVSAVAYPLLDNERKIREIVLVHDDITSRRNTDLALRESESRLRLALDAGRMGVWDWNIRTDEIKWSESLEPLHGLAPGTFGGTFDAFQKLVHPDDRESVGNAIRDAVENGSGYDIEFRNVWPNGSTHWIAGKGIVVVGPDGKAERMIGIGMDVTERKRTEQTAQFLADASATFAVLVDFESTLQKVASQAVPYFADWVAVDVLEDNGDLRRVAVAHIDPAKVALAHELHRRFPADPTASQGAWNILRTGTAELISEISDELLAQTIKEAELIQIMRELGLKSYIGVPVRVRGRTIGVITFISAESGHLYDSRDLVVAQDLADRGAIAIENTLLYREVREAGRRKDEFLATLAHELRNPLAPIRNSLQILNMPRVSPEMLQQTRDMMERQVQHLVRLVDDLLDVSRVMRGKIELRKEQVELANIVARAVETAQPLIDLQGHQLDVSLPNEPMVLNADPVRLVQVIGNLLTNAAKYMDANGKIWLTGRRESNHAVLNVRDTGIGIAADMLPHIFELFVQADHASTKAHGGLGIGLTLVRNLVEMHGGTVQARSDGLGKGSEFEIVLPLLVGTPGEVEKTSPTSTDQTRPSTGHRLLVVDDNVDAAQSLAVLLRLKGHDVQTAHDGAKAIEAAITFRPHLVLLDLGMPGMDGYEVARRLRQTPGFEKIVLAALTGWGQKEDRRRTAQSGFDYHLVKPPEPKLLDEVLASLSKTSS